MLMDLPFLEQSKKVNMNNIRLYNLCIIFNCDDEILVQKRLRGMHGYSFPGGKVNINESIEESVVREVYEETGLILEKPDYISMVSFYDEKSKERRQIFLFKATKYHGELLLKSDEGIHFWCSFSDFMKLNLVDGMEEFIQAYKGSKFEWHYNC